MTKEEREERDLEQMQTPRRKNVDDSNNKQDDEDDDDDDGYSFIFCIVLYSGILYVFILTFPMLYSITSLINHLFVHQDLLFSINDKYIYIHFH